MSVCVCVEHHGAQSTCMWAEQKKELEGEQSSQAQYRLRDKRKKKGGGEAARLTIKTNFPFPTSLFLLTARIASRQPRRRRNPQQTGAASRRCARVRCDPRRKLRCPRRRSPRTCVRTGCSARGCRATTSRWLWGFPQVSTTVFSGRGERRRRSRCGWVGGRDIWRNIS